jgi:DnaJ-class molecular chaperone
VGDLFVHVMVETPVKLSDEQKDLLKQFDESLRSGGAKHRPQARALPCLIREHEQDWALRPARGVKLSRA